MFKKKKKTVKKNQTRNRCQKKNTIPVPEHAGVWESGCGGVLVRMSRQLFFTKKNSSTKMFFSFFFFLIFYFLLFLKNFFFSKKNTEN